MRSKGFGIFSRMSLAVLALTLAGAGAAHADTFSTGQFVTYDRGGWSGAPGCRLRLGLRSDLR